jgi:endonuclease/exonuclease/phosphatase family metal-dependent hydrolase
MGCAPQLPGSDSTIRDGWFGYAATCMSLRLLTLNIEGDRHLDRVCRALAEHRPEVVCLQEVFEASCPQLAAVGPYSVAFAPTARMSATRSAAPEQNWGVAVLTRIPVLAHAVMPYAADSTIRTLRLPNDSSRAVVVTEVAHEGCAFRVATTHFTWSPGGQSSDEQREDFVRLSRVMKDFPDYVLCGDFNAPRGGEIFSRFVGELALIDHLSPEVSTTIDPRYHRAGALELVVDTVFSTPEYRATEVEVLEGLSDHKGILARIERC